MSTHEESVFAVSLWVRQEPVRRGDLLLDAHQSQRLHQDKTTVTIKTNNNKTTITTTKTNNNNKTSSNHKEKPGSLLVMNTTSYLKRIMKMKFDQPGKEESGEEEVLAAGEG